MKSRSFALVVLVLSTVPTPVFAQAFTQQLCEKLVSEGDARHKERVARVGRFWAATERFKEVIPYQVQTLLLKVTQGLGAQWQANENLQTLLGELRALSPDDRDGTLGRLLINQLVKTQDLGTVVETGLTAPLKLQVTGTSSLHFRLGTPYAVVTTTASDPNMPENAHMTQGRVIINLLTNQIEPSVKNFKEQALREPYTHWAGVTLQNPELKASVDTSHDVAACRDYLQRVAKAQLDAADAARIRGATQVSDTLVKRGKAMNGDHSSSAETGETGQAR